MNRCRYLSWDLSLLCYMRAATNIIDIRCLSLKLAYSSSPCQCLFMLLSRSPFFMFRHICFHRYGEVMHDSQILFHSPLKPVLLAALSVVLSFV